MSPDFRDGHDAAPVCHHWQILADSEIQAIQDAAWGFLQRVGYRILNRTLLEWLEKKGCVVDYPSSCVRVTPDVRRRLEDVARRSAKTIPDEPLLRRPLSRGEAVGHNYTCYYDWTEGIRRPAGLEDIRRVVRAWQMIPEIIQTGPCMTAQDVPMEIEPLVSTVEAMKLTDKIRGLPEMMLGEQLPFLEELGHVLKDGKQPPIRYSGCSVNRFTVDGRAASCLMATHERNGLRHWWINSCPVAGVTAPVTLAGAVTVGVAETIGGWLAGWACNDDISLGAVPLCGIVDMRTGGVRFSTPETILMDSAIYQFFLGVYGIRVGLCTGYTDARIPGMQAVNDKMLKSLAYGLFTDTIGGQSGTLAAGNIYSPTQQVLDIETNRQTDQLAKGIEVNEHTLALDLIEQLAAAYDGVFLSEEHTLAHWRDQLWIPEYLQWDHGDESSPCRDADMRIIERAEKKWRDAMVAYRRPDIDDRKIQAAQEVLSRATRNLLK